MMKKGTTIARERLGAISPYNQENRVTSELEHNNILIN